MESSIVQDSADFRRKLSVMDVRYENVDVFTNEHLETPGWHQKLFEIILSTSISLN